MSLQNGQIHVLSTIAPPDIASASRKYLGRTLVTTSKRRIPKSG